ncbi:MAG: amidohydrolase family protein [Oceanicaulis sp.]
MVMLLTEAARASAIGAEHLSLRSPVPLSLVSNGEYTPRPASPALKRAGAALTEHAGAMAKKLGQSAEQFLAGPAGFASAFAAMNTGFGGGFEVGRGEASDPDMAAERAGALSKQFVFDDQVHFLRDDADEAFFKPLTDMIALSADLLDLPRDAGDTIDRIKFLHFLKEIYLDSDTKVALLSGAPSDDLPGWMLTNDQMAAARTAVNRIAGETRLLTHAVIAPGHAGWLDEMDRVHETIRPDGWKGYSVGEPFGPSAHRWRLDDEALMYPAYEKLVKAGVKNLCIHKGILPEDHEDFMPGAEPFAKVDDVGKAAKDWPELNFVIYHAGYRTVPAPTEGELARFEADGRIDWVTDLAAIPAAYGVSNIYADIGACFAFTVLTHPRLCAGLIGTLIKGLGADKVLWGTDSVWYGSPQWQIEAFRRLQMPEDLMEKHGWPDLGPADGPLKSSILGLNGAPLYRLDPANYADAPQLDNLDAMRAEYVKLGGARSNMAFGYAAREEKPNG